MYAGKLIFAQLTDLIHPEQFHRCVRRYHGDYKVKTFSCWNQFLCMAFGQLTFRESLRDVETCLRSRHDQLYHLLYKARWKVELFFKWIKQHLRIKHFYGTSDNAVKTRIWISICVYVLVAIVKKQLESEKSLYSILQILSVNAFEQEPLHQILRDSPSQISEDSLCNQLVFNY
jgi:hypothetical protein